MSTVCLVGRSAACFLVTTWIGGVKIRRFHPTVLPLPFPSPAARESEFLLGLFLSGPLAVLVFRSLQDPGWDTYGVKQKTQGSCSQLHFPLILIQSTCFYLPFRSFDSCFTHFSPRFLVVGEVISKRAIEQRVISLFYLEKESHCLFLLKNNLYHFDR